MMSDRKWLNCLFRPERTFGGFRGGGSRGGERRSDIRLKHDVVLLGRLDNGLG
jgi:hypothetical protein